MRRKMMIITTLILIAFNLSILLGQTRDRNEIAVRYTWDLSEIYIDDQAWNLAVVTIMRRMPKISLYKGRLSESAEVLLQCMELKSEIDKELDRLYCYPFLALDLDTREAKYLSMKNKAFQLQTEFNSLCAFIQPEILQIEAGRVEQFLQTEPALETYRFFLQDLLRTREHTLTNTEEEIVAQAGLMSNGPATIYNIFTNADMPYPIIELSNGDKVELNQANFSLYRTLTNRSDREKVFQNFFELYGNFERTLGTTMDAKIKKDLFYSRVRKYNSCLEYSLDDDNIPPVVYHNLIKNVHNNLDALHRYLNIRKRMLKVDTLKYTDLYVPLVENLDVRYTPDGSIELIIRALQPLGEEYIQTVRYAFENRWIDFFPTLGKRAGAYSMGAAHDVHPYILMNFNGQYANVSTLAHELGHTLHSYYSSKTQPYATSDYATFVAEVASTLNEILLFRDQYDHAQDDNFKLFLLIEYIDRMKSTIFRQTQFAEFELRAHELVEQGGQITGEALTKIYCDLVREYYGHAENICYVDDFIDYEWAYIPHFYRDFYVFQYSTSWTASEALATDVLAGDSEAVDRFIALISAGGSDYPINQLKTAGVDMTTDVPFQKAMANMHWAMDEIEKILDVKGL
jgi:oligoendopeptidase F